MRAASPLRSVRECEHEEKTVGLGSSTNMGPFRRLRDWPCVLAASDAGRLNLTLVPLLTRKYFCEVKVVTAVHLFSSSFLGFKGFMKWAGFFLYES
jgi:hypothetical protein